MRHDDFRCVDTVAAPMVCKHTLLGYNQSNFNQRFYHYVHITMQQVRHGHRT
jgi:hypothetical protein